MIGRERLGCVRITEVGWGQGEELVHLSTTTDYIAGTISNQVSRGGLLL